jgi:hypothetical protein
MSQKNMVVCLMLCVCSSASTFLATSITHAALTAYEPFNYANIGGELNGQSGSGSFGFSGAWVSDPSITVGSGSLVSPVQPLSTSGNAMTSVAYGANRYIPRTLLSTLGAAGTTSYVSFLMRPEGILHQGAFEGWFDFSLQGDRITNVGMGSFTNTYGLEVGGTSTFTNLNAVVGATTLFVLRVDFTAGVDTLRLYVNPQPGAGEPAVASTSQNNIDIGTINHIELDGPGAYTFDELRIGTTYADVVPVPEPSASCLAAVAVFSMLCRKRKRAKT